MKRAASPVRRYCGNFVLLVVACFALGPVALLLENSLKPHEAIVRNPLEPPRSLDFANFTTAWTEGHFTTGLLNSLLLCAATVAITLSAAVLAAYPLARSRARGIRLLALLFLCSVTVPIQLFLFPLYFVFAHFNLIGNVFATAVILAAINLPLAIFLLRTYIMTIPTELDDAGLMDGAGPFQVFWYIIFPLTRPGLVTVAALVCLNVWNEYLVTSTFQQGENHFTMTLGYLAMNGSISADQGLLMAGGVLVIVPILLVFMGTRRFIIGGLTAGAVKG